MACGGRMSGPVCLIEDDRNGMLCVRKEAKDILDGITEPVVVVSVVGLYRTGKSYLMNRLAGQQSGFALSSTIESKTKGIWMWCVPHPRKFGHTLVLLDTEGLGDVEKGDTKHDTWIFCLAVLLSSTLVYNSLGDIGNMALEKLHYVSELTENIRVKAEGSRDEDEDEDETEDFMRIFPSFVWAVRDFTLKLVIGGEKITSDEYLDLALKLEPDRSHWTEQYNLPRRCLRRFFAVRKCFVFPRPASIENMWRMEQLTEKELDSEFLHQANTFCEYIYSNSETKTVNGGRTITGTALGNLAEVYIEAIRSGKVPCLENAVVSMGRIQNVRAVDEAMQVYMTEMLSQAQLPMDPADLSNIHAVIEKKAIEVFINMSLNDNDQNYQKELMKKINEEYQKMCLQNNEASHTLCQNVLCEVFDALEQNISNGAFLRSGGYRQYRDMLTQMTRVYRERTCSQIMSEEALSVFLRAKEEIGNTILKADQSLSKAEQQSEVQRLKTEIAEQQQRRLGVQNRLQIQAYKDMERACDEHVNQLLHQMAREMERMRRDNKQVLDAKLKECEAFLEKGFHREAYRMEREIYKLKIDMEFQWMPKRSTVRKVFVAVGKAATLPLPAFDPKAIGGISDVSSSAPSLSKVFMLEVLQGNEDKLEKIFRFVCPRAGQFRCSLTALVFVVEAEAELLYKTLSWDPRRLDGLGTMKPAGPLYNIDCFMGSISQLHLPHCEILSEETEDSLAVAHYTGDNVEIMKPFKVTETHVIINIEGLSIFGLIKRLFFPPSPVVAQVLLFLRPKTVKQKENILDVHLLPWNVPVSEVKEQHAENTYIKTTPKCSLTPGTEYSLICQPEASTVQPETDMFECNFGPNYHPTFEVFVDVNTDEVTLGLKTDSTEVWCPRRILLTGRDEERPAHQMLTACDFLKKHRNNLVQRVLSGMMLADCLRSEGMITDEMYTQVQRAETPQNRNRLLLYAVESGGASVKAYFYRKLKEEEPYLVDDLESGPSGSH